MAHGQDIPLAILEPGSFRAPRARDAVLHLDPWHVILLDTTPLALSSATSAATSLTTLNAVLAFDVPHTR